MVDVTGPIGGLLAATWGAGAVSGFGFASVMFGSQIKGLKAQVTDLTTRLRAVEDRAYFGMERQASQIRSSTIHLIEDGKINPPLGGVD